MLIQDNTHYWRNPPVVWGVVAASLILLLYSYWGGLAQMFEIWARKEEYGYAYFLPFITLYLIWQRRDKLAAEKFRPSWIGVVAIVFAGFLFFLGMIATTYTLVQYSLVMVVFGFAYAVLGWQAFKVVFGPLCLLFFVVPLPPFIFNTLSGKLQLISSQIGVDFIRWFGISVYLEGNVIDLGDYKLQVVEACSGLRYLFPLVSLAFLAAYLYRVELWKRGVVFLSSIPITVFMNSFRVGVIGILVNKWGQEQADGFLHYFEGWVVFMACLSILLLEMALLARVGRHKKPFKEVFGLEMQKPLPKYSDYKKRSVSIIHYGILASLSLIALGSFYVEEQEEVIPMRQSFANFPGIIDEWQGDQDSLEDVYLRSLKLDDYLISDYFNTQGEMVNFYIAYYASQQAGSAAHSPRACIPGGGWKIEKVTQVYVPGIVVNGSPLLVNRLNIKKGDARQLVYYWFQQRGRVIASEWFVKWFLFYDGLTKHRTDGALVRLTTSVGLGEEWDDGDKRLVEFVGEVVPLLNKYIPN
jgi:exosortase D (VPLPA-CTERM-specific)